MEEPNGADSFDYYHEDFFQYFGSDYDDCYYDEDFFQYFCSDYDDCYYDESFFSDHDYCYYDEEFIPHVSSHDDDCVEEDDDCGEEKGGEEYDEDNSEDDDENIEGDYDDNDDGDYGEGDDDDTGYCGELINRSDYFDSLIHLFHRTHISDGTGNHMHNSVESDDHYDNDSGVHDFLDKEDLPDLFEISYFDL